MKPRNAPPNAIAAALLLALISAEDYGPNEFSVVISIGVPLSVADLRIT